MDRGRAGGAEPLIKAGRYEDALELLEPQLRGDPCNWYLNYLAGQCHRFCGRDDDALRCLAEADRLRGANDSSVLLALAIAYQRTGRYSEAVETMKRSLKDHPDHLPSVNTLAMTQKLMGAPDKASYNYDLALKILARSVVDGMVNDRGAPIHKHQPWEQRYSAWVEYATFAATDLGVREGADSIAWPSGEAAREKEATEAHGGLFWIDHKKGGGTTMRVFLPNFFTTFRERMTRHPMYAILIGNRSTVIRMLGDIQKAEDLLREAQFFSDGS